MYEMEIGLDDRQIFYVYIYIYYIPINLAETIDFKEKITSSN